MRPPFSKPFENKIARGGIGAYRSMWSGSIYKKTKVITYTEKEIRDYLDGPYKDLISKIKLKDGYKWVVGFYMKREDNADGNPRNAFYVVPTMQLNDDSDIHDYYDNMSDYNDGTGVPLDDQKTPYDAGHLWP